MSLIKKLPPMLSGSELEKALAILPEYDPEIVKRHEAVRLIALSDMYKVFVPNQMSKEIYSKLYLALLRSLQKKDGILRVKQSLENHKAGVQQEYNGILGGSDSFTVLGVSGIGKSSCISRAVQLLTNDRIIATDKPYRKILPCVLVQCPFDSSVKGLLLEIIRVVDEQLGSSYYAAYTGNVILDVPLQDCTDAVISVLHRYMERPGTQEKKGGEDKATQKKAEKLDKQAEKIISTLRNQKNGDRFSRLFDKGEMDGCTDQSSLDIILCAMIAYRTKDDMELLDAVFRKSALYREKWEREDYREETMAKAIQRRDSRIERHKSHPFIKVNEDGIARVSAPLLAKYAREHLDYLLVRNDGTEAVMKYVYKNGVYTLYDTAMLHGVIKGLIADYDEELVKMSTIKEVVSLLLSDLDYIPQECLNQNEDVINFQNGLLRISGDQTEMIPHSPEVLSTIQIPCCWQEESIPTPVFDQYMTTLTNGDKEVEQLLLEYMGACISNVQGWRMKKTLFLVGSGDTGKSQLKSLTERLLGKPNFASMDLSEIEARFGTSAIYGKRLIGSSDMSFMNIREIKTLKRITGGDNIHAEFKCQSSFTYTFQGLPWFCMNRLPRFSGDTGQWVYDRIMIVECQNVIPPDKQDKKLLDKMYAEREGIVQKAIYALMRVIANGYRFTEPESVKVARSKYQADNSTVITFFEECMCPWPNGIINTKGCTTGKIHDAYREWCRRNNNGHSKSGKEFRDELATYLCTTFADMSTRRNGNTFYREYTLTEEAQEELSS